LFPSRFCVLFFPRYFFVCTPSKQFEAFFFLTPLYPPWWLPSSLSSPPENQLKKPTFSFHTNFPLPRSELRCMPNTFDLFPRGCCDFSPPSLLDLLPPKRFHPPFFGFQIVFTFHPGGFEAVAVCTPPLKFHPQFFFPPSPPTNLLPFF